MNFVKKINAYLLTHYPLIWNTRLVWMLGVSAITHILFFLIGYFAVSNQVDIESEYSLSEFYFGTSIVFFNVLLCIIVLLVWIVYYLQNNAFKNLYALKRGALFTQFCILLCIIFINITQYYSFNQGIKLKIRNLYAWETVDKDIKELNKTAVFLINEAQNYRINAKAYPAPFPLEFSNTNQKNNTLTHKIDTTKAYFLHEKVYYQFYEVNTQLKNEELKEEEKEISSYQRTARYEDEETDFKYRIVKDVSSYKDDINNCLINYSSTLYRYGQDATAHNERLKYYENLFNKGDEGEIKENLQSFLNLATKYKIENNLNVEEWYGLLDENNYTYATNLIEENETTDIYEVQKQEKERKNYRIKQFILPRKASEREKRDNKYTKTIVVENNVIEDREYHLYKKGAGYDPITIRGSKTYSKYKEVALSNIPYCDLGYVDRFFSNTYSAYQPDRNILETLLFYIIVTLVFGLLLFLFKVTDIKTLLLSFVAAAVILIITGLCIGYSSSIFGYYTSDIMEMSIAIAVGASIIISSLMAFKLKRRKSTTAILFILALFTIPILLGVLFGAYRESMSYDERKHDFVYSWIKEYIFFIILLIWILSIGLYTKVIRKWKGLPE